MAETERYLAGIQAKYWDSLEQCARRKNRYGFIGSQSDTSSIDRFTITIGADRSIHRTGGEGSIFSTTASPAQELLCIYDVV